MPKYTCAVADCNSYSERKDEQVKGWCVFPRKKDSTRRKLWETRCKRGPNWRATKYHAICSKHFTDWGQGPSPSHPDPELFAYNRWGKKKSPRKSVYKASSNCNGITERPCSTSATDSSSLSSSSDDEPPIPLPKVDFCTSSEMQVQDYIEVEVKSGIQELSSLTGIIRNFWYTVVLWSDVTYSSDLHSSSNAMYP